MEHLVAECPSAPWNRNKGRISDDKRRYSNAKENNLKSRPTSREVNLFSLMNVNKPKYLEKGKTHEYAVMTTSEVESVLSTRSSDAKEVMDLDKDVEID